MKRGSTDSGLAETFRGFARFAGAAVAVLGAAVLLGWVLDVAALKSIHPAWVSMKSNTAIGFLLAGIALRLLAVESPAAWPRRTAATAAVAVAMVGLATLAEYFGGVDLGFDELLIRDDPASSGTAYPGRMAISTAVNFCLLGSALLLASGRRERTCGAAAWFALAAAILAYMGLVSFLFAVPADASGVSTRMAFHTALAFLVLAVGVAAARPECRFVAILASEFAGGLIARRLLPISVLALPLLGFLRLLGEKVGWYGFESGLVLMVTSAVVVLGAMIFWNAAALNRRDAAARESAEQLRQITDSIQEIFFLIDAETRVVLYASPAHEAIYGTPVRSIIGRPDAWMEQIHPEDRERIRQQVAMPVGQAKPEIEFRIIRPDGGIRQLLARTFPVRDGEGRIVRIAGLVDDVTLRKEMEENLKRTNEMSAVVDSLLRLAQEEKPLEVILERAFEHTLAIPWLTLESRGAVFLADETTGQLAMTVSRGLTEAVRQACARVPAGFCLCGRAAASGKTVFAAHLDERHEVHYAGITDHGHYCVPIVSGGRVLGVFNVYQEAGRAHSLRVEEFLGTVAGVLAGIILHRRVENERFRLAQAIEQSGDGVMLTDIGGVIFYVNPACARLTGYAKEELVGLNAVALNSGAQGEEFHLSMWSELEAGREWSGVFANRRKDGTVYQEAASISPLRDPFGQVSGYIAVKRDVTRERQVEAELRQAQRMETVGRLAGGVAHDFNNLLTVISAHVEALMEEIPVHDPRREGVDEIGAAAGRAAGLTRQLLAFSRRQVVAPRSVDLGAIVRELEKMLRRLIGENVELVVRFADELGLIRADAGQLEQVIMNLVVNARDAMPDGGRLTLEVANGECIPGCPRGVIDAPMGQGHVVRLMVSDTGTGMDEATRTRIFEPFFTTKEAGKGTGMGLATVYGIVKQSDGHIGAESEPGRGTRFTICFPRVAGIAAESVTPPPAAGTSHGHELILLVEDDEKIRKVVRRGLDRLGYVVLVAADGVEALSIAGERVGEINLLVTDMVMPGMGGAELARRLRERQQELRVLFMSGYTDDEIVRNGVLEPGMNFIQKPFTLADLGRKIREALR